MSENSPVPVPSSVTLTVDEAAHSVLLAALDLFQRVQMGQWERVAEACHLLLGDQAGPFTEAAQALQRVRCQFAVNPVLQQYPNASLGVLESGPQARIAYDVWHALGGGMESRQADRWSDARIDVTVNTTP